MNDSHSLPDSNAPKKAETGFLFDDWNLSEEENPTDNTTLFDGKIIARMPDLGSESIVKNIKKPNFPSFWGQMCSSALAVIPRGTSSSTGIQQRFFQRVTTIGGLMLLCGVGILLIGSDKDRQPENDLNIAEILAGTTDSISKPGVTVAESAFLPVLQPETGTIMPGVSSNSAIPVAPIASVAAIGPPSPWDRPVADSHSPWEQPRENSFQPVEGAVVNGTPAMPHETVAMVPMVPMVPIGNGTSMPVSPFEVQLVAQSNVPTHATIPPGMMPMQERQGNMPRNVPQQNAQHTQNTQHAQWQHSAPQQFPLGTHGHATSGNNNNFHGQATPHTQYVVPPGYMLPPHQTAPQNMPIPSGVSMLPPQGGQPMQSHGMPIQHAQPQGVPASSVPSDFHFYNAPPQNHRQMFW